MDENTNILARNRSGWSLLEYRNMEESEVEHYDRVTGAYAIVCIKGCYLIGYNNWRKQWEFPISLQFKGMVKVMAPNGDTRWQAVYLGYKDELDHFVKQDNDEMDKILLWDLKEDIGYFDECDLEIMLRMIAGGFLC